MTRLVSPRELATLHLTLSVLVLGWDLWIAGRTARVRAAPRSVAFLSALAGLLLVPALTVVVVSDSLVAGRALYSIVWIWPATVILVTAQAYFTLRRRLAAPAIGIPILAFDLLLSVVYTARLLVFLGADPGLPLLSFVAADRAAVAVLARPQALLDPWFLFLPVFAPSTPTRRGPGTVLRSAVALVAALWGALILVQVPFGSRAVRSYARYAREPLQERPDSDFAIGLKVFPPLWNAPVPISIQTDLSLADSLGAEVLSVYITPHGASSSVLDSLSHVLDDVRGDRVIIAALDFSRELPVRASRRGAYLRERTRDVARIASHVQPDFVVPVVDPNGTATRAIGRITPAQWCAYEREAAAAAKAVYPAARVMAHVGGFGAADSALYACAATSAPEVDALAFSLFPSLRGAATLDARMRAADAWMRAYPTGKPQWVLEAGGFPLAHGEASQALAIHGTLAWATSRAAIKGLVVYEAADHVAPVGLRAAGGRLRDASTEVRRAIAALEEK